MTANDVLDILLRLTFILLSLTTAIDYLLHKDNIRRDIALMFSSIAVPLMLPSLTHLISDAPSPLIGILGGIALIAQPFLLLRLLRYFHRVPRWLMRTTGISMIFLWVALADASLLPPVPLVIAQLILVVYFAGVDGYAMIAFVKGAFTASGVVRQRLRFVAAGSGLLALFLPMLGLILLVPALREIFSSFVLLDLLAAALCYYIGFVPPRWLRRAWQLSEFRNFLLQISSRPINERIDVSSSLDELCTAANKAVNGMAAAVAQFDELEKRWTLRHLTNQADPISGDTFSNGIIQQVWVEGRPVFVRASAGLNEAGRRLLKTFEAETVLVAPVATLERDWGVLLVFLKHSSLFIQDDLDLVMLLAHQSAIFLENTALIEELHHHSEDLEAKVAERTLEVHKSREEYRRIVEIAQEGIWVADKEGKTAFVNARMAELLGYTVEEMLGMTSSMFRYEGSDAFVLQARERRSRGVKEQYEFKLRRKDGSPLYALVSSTPLTDDQGQYSGSLGMIADITERVKAEEQITHMNRELERLVTERTEQLRQSEVKFSKAFRASPAAISIATLPDGRWIEINEALARMTGYTSEELLGHTSSEFGFVDTIARAKIIEAIGEHGRIRNVEIQLRTRSNEILDVLLSAEQIEIDGQPCSLTIQYDISELKRAEREVRRLKDDLERRQVALEAANKELEAFSYSVSHDLRAPLRAMDGFSQALLEDYHDQLDSQGQDFLARVRNGSQQMAKLIDGLLQLSRLSRSELQLDTVNLSKLAGEIAAELQEQTPEREAEFIIADGLTVSGDEALMRVVLTNLLGNAWKFTRRQAHTHIEFGTTDHHGKQTYFIRDNGAGFDMAYADKLFGAFQRLHQVTEFEGTGIGLATVQRVIRRHNGEIWAESAVNEGATFYFTLDS